MRKLLKFLLSGYFITAVLLILEILTIGAVIIYAEVYFAWFAAASAAISFLVLVNLITRDVNPEFKVSWIVIILLLPIYGIILYAMFYSRRLTRGEAARIRQTAEALNRATSYRREENLSVLDSLAEEDASAAGRALSLLCDDETSEIYRNTELKYFSQGEAMYEALLLDLEKAKRFIFLEMFIIEPGQMWDSIHNILRKKVKEGVSVHMVYDDMGCIRKLPRAYDKQLRREGIMCYRFAKFTPVLSGAHNNRDHRKIIVIDGVIGYTGGINIADEYINKKTRFGHWKDGGIRLFGDAALGLAKQFMICYSPAERENTDVEIGHLTSTAHFAAEISESLRAEEGYYIPFGSGPAPIYKRPVGKSAIMNIVNRAERYLYITTPYLIIDYDLTEALRSAAMRGVDVRIITPGIPDKKIIKIMTKSAYPYLIESGVRIFEYTPGFIHEKLIISDDLSAIIGTINMDYRSLVHHFEDAVWIYGAKELPYIREQTMQTLAVCREIEKKKAKLNLFERIVRSVVRLFSPLL